MKNTKKFAAFVASILAVACMAAPMATSFSADAASITLTSTGATVDHTYSAYQIFTGTLADGKLGDLKWGANVGTYNGSSVTTGDEVPEEVINAITAYTNNDAVGLRDWVAENITTKGDAAGTATGKETATIENLTDGYYLVKDSVIAGSDEAASTWMLQVAGDATQAIKNAKPSVDKFVQDEAADKDTTTVGNATDDEKAAGWAKSADHEIGETFQFKLKATIPVDADLAAYKTYKLVFTDTLLKGVTFEKITSVTVNGTTVAADKYTSTAVNGDTNKSFTVTLDDVKELAGSSFGTREVTVEVFYDAHLNADADVAGAANDTTTNNHNKVYLEYSNNPNVGGEGELGKTNEEDVDVYTYLANGKKVAGDENGDATTTPLAGVKFRLYDALTEGNEIKVVSNGEGNGNYRLAIGEEEGVDIVTDADGKFVIKGLDNGTYYLEETETLAGYNLLKARQEVTLTATHSHEKVLTLNYSGAVGTGEDANTYVIVNNQGSTLPSTGGIGTTIFYVAGGALVVGAGVLLVSKKRMSNK